MDWLEPMLTDTPPICLNASCVVSGSAAPWRTSTGTASVEDTAGWLASPSSAERVRRLLPRGDAVLVDVYLYPMCVVRNGDRCEVVFTLRRAPGYERRGLRARRGPRPGRPDRLVAADEVALLRSRSHHRQPEQDLVRRGALRCARTRTARRRGSGCPRPDPALVHIALDARSATEVLDDQVERRRAVALAAGGARRSAASTGTAGCSPGRRPRRRSSRTRPACPRHRSPMGWRERRGARPPRAATRARR